MISNKEIKPYKKNMNFSYALGAFPTYELLYSRPERVIKILVHSSYTDYDHLKEVCNQRNVEIEVNDKIITKIRDKQNSYVIGIVEKYQCELEKNKPHIVLVEPSNMGNIGTIIRAAVGFGIYNIGVIGQAADIFNPKTIRSSMGAIFKVSFKQYDNFKNYQEEFLDHEIFNFMLNKEKSIKIHDAPIVKNYSLVFGNEATGLDDSFLKIGTSVYIPQSPDVDSLNLPIAAAIGMYEFTKRNNH